MYCLKVHLTLIIAINWQRPPYNQLRIFLKFDVIWNRIQISLILRDLINFGIGTSFLRIHRPILTLDCMIFD